jgi:hypothetical protein
MDQQVLYRPLHPGSSASRPVLARLVAHLALETFLNAAGMFAPEVAGCVILPPRVETLTRQPVRSESGRKRAPASA